MKDKIVIVLTIVNSLLLMFIFLVVGDMHKDTLTVSKEAKEMILLDNTILRDTDLKVGDLIFVKKQKGESNVK